MISTWHVLIMSDKTRMAGEDMVQQKAANLETAIQMMHKHPTAVTFTYLMPGEHKLGGTVFLKGKKPVPLSFLSLSLLYRL